MSCDRDGNVTAEGRSLTGVSGDAGANTQTFSYDGMNWLVASSGLAASATYEYDRDGNRTKATLGALTMTFTYDRTGVMVNRTDSGQLTGFTYDRHGNQEEGAQAFNSKTAYTYDAADRLTGIDVPAPTTR